MLSVPRVSASFHRGTLATMPTSRRFMSSDKSNDAGFLRKFMGLLRPKVKDEHPENIPSDYVDPHSLSGNPTMRTVPVDSQTFTRMDQDIPSVPTSNGDRQLRVDEKEDSVFHHHHHDGGSQTTSFLGKIEARIMIAMNCDACDTKLVKSMSKKSYVEGVVLIRCDGCRSVHLIADNLGWFDDKNVNIEDIMKLKGEEVLRGNADEGFDSLTPELVEKLREVAKNARDSDLNVPIGGAQAMKEIERENQRKSEDADAGKVDTKAISGKKQ